MINNIPLNDKEALRKYIFGKREAKKERLKELRVQTEEQHKRLEEHIYKRETVIDRERADRELFAIRQRLAQTEQLIIEIKASIASINKRQKSDYES